MSELEAKLEVEAPGPLGERPRQGNPYGRKRNEEPSTGELLAEINRPVPFSDEAEKGVLSAVMQNPEAWLPEMRRKLSDPEAFHHEANRIVWEGLLKLHDDNKPLDPVLLTNALSGQGLLDRVGGAAAVVEMFGFITVPAHAPHYLKVMLDKWTLRKVLHQAALIASEAQLFGANEAESDVVAFVTAAESRMFKLVEEAQSLGESSTGSVLAKQGVAEWVDHLQRTIDNRGQVLGLTTGIHEVDMTLHGIDDAEGEICVLAGRPAMGKTAMAVTIANHLAVEKDVPGLIFSIEMSANQLYTRLILGPAGIDTSKAITGHFSREDHDAMGKQARLVQRSPMLVCASAAVSTADLRAQAQLAKRRHGIRWIMVDHLHLVKSVNPRVQGDERMRLVEVMETLQYLKKDLHLGVFLLVQMNRDTDKNPGKPPVLADLSGSAAIEQFADHVIFIHREDEYTKWHRLGEDKREAWAEQILPRRERSPDLWSDGLKYDEESGGYARQDYEEKAMLYVRKNRRGPTPELQIRFQKELTRFTTRMPRLNSTNPLDWQMGSYATSPKRKASKEARPVGQARADLENIFPDE